MVNFKVLSDKTYFDTYTQGIKQFRTLEATAEGIIIYVYGKGGEVETIDHKEIKHIIIENKPETFGNADKFIRFLKSELADKPLLFDFILALWNEDYSRTDAIVREDACIIESVLTYLHSLVEIRDFNSLLSNIFGCYVRYRDKKLK